MASIANVAPDLRQSVLDVDYDEALILQQQISSCLVSDAFEPVRAQFYWTVSSI
jgi:hypothetical protein